MDGAENLQIQCIPALIHGFIIRRHCKIQEIIMVSAIFPKEVGSNKNGCRRGATDNDNGETSIGK